MQPKAVCITVTLEVGSLQLRVKWNDYFMGLANYPFVYTAQQDVCFLHNSRTLWIHVQFVICCNSWFLSCRAVVFLCSVFIHSLHMAVHFHVASPLISSSHSFVVLPPILECIHVSPSTVSTPFLWWPLLPRADAIHKSIGNRTFVAKSAQDAAKHSGALRYPQTIFLLLLWKQDCLIWQGVGSREKRSLPLLSGLDYTSPLGKSTEEAGERETHKNVFVCVWCGQRVRHGFPPADNNGCCLWPLCLFWQTQRSANLIWLFLLP